MHLSRAGNGRMVIRRKIEGKEGLDSGVAGGSELRQRAFGRTKRLWRPGPTFRAEEGSVKPNTLFKIGSIVVLLAAVSASASSASVSGRSAATGGSVTLGLMGPLTGNRAAVGAGMASGAKLALNVINASGGVLGKKVNLSAQDDAADPGDAVPAAEKLIQSDHVVGIVGPTAFTASVVLPLADRAKIPDLMWGGGDAFDRETDPLFFRLSPSDTEQADAMVVYAFQKGWKKIGLALGNGAADQSLLPGIQAAAKKLGISIVGQVTIAVGATSFRSEIQQLYQNHPQAILGQFDIGSAGVLFGELSQEGQQSTPWVASNLWYASEFVQSVGNSTASGPIYIANPAANGPGERPFLAVLKAKTGRTQPNNGEEVMWDATTAWALGAEMAGTMKSPAVEKGILKATRPPGTRCYTFTTCLKLIRKHKDINFDGAASSVDFDGFHNVFGPFAILHYDSSGAAQQISLLTPQYIQSVLTSKKH
jgi:ABC-type branched-subunit amino acid transport system substrate-binding protein